MLGMKERVMRITAAILKMSVMIIITTSLNGGKENQESSALLDWRRIRITFSHSWRRELARLLHTFMNLIQTYSLRVH